MRRTTIVALILTLVTPACGGSSRSPIKATGRPSIKASVKASVELKEFSITVDPSAVTSGKVMFETRNTGVAIHELVVLRTNLAAGSLPMKGDKVDEEAAEMTSLGEIGEFSGGKTESKIFEMTRGTYVLICNIPGHYKQGMRTTLTVT